MKPINLGALCACALTLAISTTANAALISVLGGAAVEDTVNNLTWVSNANLAATDSFGVSPVINSDGAMYLLAAQTWINAMNAADYLGYNDWRLPTTLQPDASCSNQSGGTSGGYNCTGSEMGHLFYNELGGVAGSDIATTHNTNYYLFSNLQSNYYWSSTGWISPLQPSGSTPTNYWTFDFNGGSQDVNADLGSLYTLAVRSGQVATVPLPAATWLFGSGLVSLIGMARRRKTV